LVSILPNKEDNIPTKKSLKVSKKKNNKKIDLEENTESES